MVKKHVKVVKNVLIECWKPDQSKKTSFDHRPISAS